MRIGFLGALAILFIALKLCNVVAWSWWWVLAPLWIPAAICAAIPVVTFGVCCMAVLGALTIGVVAGAKKRPTVPTMKNRKG